MACDCVHHRGRPDLTRIELLERLQLQKSGDFLGTRLRTLQGLLISDARAWLAGLCSGHTTMGDATSAQDERRNPGAIGSGVLHCSRRREAVPPVGWRRAHPWTMQPLPTDTSPLFGS